MPNQTIQIKSILGGESQMSLLSADDQYYRAEAIDPDFPCVSGSFSGNYLAGGVITPTNMAKFSSKGVDDKPLYFIYNPKNSDIIYVALLNGSLISYTNLLASETDIGQITGNVCNGASYYNNYIYMASGTDVSRYGPLSDSPAIANTFWTSTLSKTALDNSFSSVCPKHPMHVHTDNKLYIGDWDPNELKGIVHYIKTKKTTAPGDTDDVSLYNAIDLPFGYVVTDIDSYGTDLVIAASQVSTSFYNNGKACLFFWDTFSASFYQQIFLDDPVVSAIKNLKGSLYVYSGVGGGGSHKVGIYTGGENVTTIASFETGYPTYKGQIATNGDRVLFASRDVYGKVIAKSLGFKDSKLNGGSMPILTPYVSTSGASSATDGALAVHVQSGAPTVLIGYYNGTSYGIDKSRSGTYVSNIISQTYNIGSRFEIKKIRIPLSDAVGANTTITPLIYVDNGYTTFSGTTYGLDVINNTNFSGKRNIIFEPKGIIGESNFNLKLSLTGSDGISVMLPITIEINKIEE